ncbi:MAG: hypothetical protein DRP49_09060, partial [Spirochaetes bacterium]
MNPIQGLIPEPSRITTLKGKFTLDNNVIISWVGAEAESTAFLRTEYLRTATGFTLPLEAGLNGTIQLRWRGLHLDVCRHFFSVKEVCRFIDLMALHRLNMFHFHITEDQGWRIEIKKYPKLTEIGSIRKATLIGYMNDRPRKYDNTPYGGFYTQDQIREIVAFAAARLISVVPEIDMPGHMAVAITAYPELENTGAQLGIRTTWGISSSVLNIEDSTVDFIRDVLDEVMDLFPGRFIHIGGDESPKQEWSESHRAQERMVELGLKSEDELQSWFIPKRNERSELVHSRMSEGKAWFHTPRLCRGTGSRLSDSGSR